MGIYIATFALSISIAFCMLHYKDGIISIANKYDGSRNLLITIMAGMPLFLVSALQKNVGADYWTYYNHVKNFSLSSSLGSEWLYDMLSIFIKKNGLDPQWFFVITSAIFVFFTMYVIISKSPMPELSIFLLFGTTYYMRSLCEIRQLTSSAILLFSIRFIEKKQFAPFLLFVLVAAGLHNTAYLYIVVYFLYQQFKSPFEIVVMILVMMIFYETVANLMINLAELTRYGVYIDSETTGVYWNRLLINVAVLIVSLIYFNNNNKTFKILYILQSLTVIANLFNSSVDLLRRMNLTFGLPVVIFLPFIIQNIEKERDRYLIAVATIVLYFIYGYYATTHLEFVGIPYASILSGGI